MLETMSGRVIPRQNWYAFRKMATTAILPLQQSAWRSLRKDASPWPSPRSKRLPAGTPFGSNASWSSRESATARRGGGVGGGGARKKNPQSRELGCGRGGGTPPAHVAGGGGGGGRGGGELWV